jgi:hypothetical protein
MITSCDDIEFGYEIWYGFYVEYYTDVTVHELTVGNSNSGDIKIKEYKIS